ncbi:uncharacterized protein SCHCODRAFT_02736375 [Schizophyllum commune H4-8]|nr:uncharacterized protein SCHCODRAFT_02736375 [Schizophyllum commune H4-8]KAI5889856.1 hypothetical protein SCHCODRAFT_02736375 [Schizophyllum commune H4-8]
MSSKSSLSFVDANVAVRVLIAHGKLSSSPHATPTEFIAKATDCRLPSGVIRCVVRLQSPSRALTIVQALNAEYPPRNGLGISVLRAKVLPSCAHRLPASLSFPRPPSLLNRARALRGHAPSPHPTPHRPISSLIAAFHAHQSSQAPKQRPISSAEGRAAPYDASGEFTVRDTSLELMRKTYDALSCSREATRPSIAARRARLSRSGHLYLSKTSDVSRSSSPRRHRAVALTSLFSFCEQQHGLARQPQQLVLDLGLAFASASRLLPSVASPLPSYCFKSPSASLHLASRLTSPSFSPPISSPFASLRLKLPHAPQTSSRSPNLSDALPTTPHLPAPSDQ